MRGEFDFNPEKILNKTLTFNILNLLNKKKKKNKNSLHLKEKLRFLST